MIEEQIKETNSYLSTITTMLGEILEELRKPKASCSGCASGSPMDTTINVPTSLPVIEPRVVDIDVTPKQTEEPETLAVDWDTVDDLDVLKSACAARNIPMKERQRKPAYRKALKAWELSQVQKPADKAVVTEPIVATSLDDPEPVVDPELTVDPHDGPAPTIQQPASPEPEQKPDERIKTGNDITILEVVTRMRDVIRVCGRDTAMKILAEEGGAATTVNAIDSKRWPKVMDTCNKYLEDVNVSKEGL